MKTVIAIGSGAKMMNLDCHTKQGKSFIEKQKETGALIEAYFGVSVEHVKYDAEKFDAYIYKNNKLVSVCEIKTRPFFNRKRKTPCTLDLLKKEGYLITAEKLDVLREQSIKLGVRTFVFVNLPLDNKILCFKITDRSGSFVIDFERERTRTRYSCNDYKGDTIRENAFVPIEGNKHFKSFDY